MDGGETENGTAGETDSSVSSVNRTVGALSERFSGLGVDDSGESRDGAWKTEKDPRRIARKYQIDLCKKAMEENIIVCLGTGCGKTHIAVLLIYEMGHLIKKPQKNICVFLAPTVALVQQQAKVIQDSIDFSVGTYCGSSKRLKGHRDWEKEIEQYEVLVMTPQILLHNLSHCFIRMELIALLIFDECHYAQVESNHPYAEIMKVFYKTDVVKLPRIFGMTASPILGKGASINSLETLLRAKVYSVEDKDELEQFVTSPKFNVYFYGPVTDSLAPTHVIYYGKLEEIKRQCVSIMSSNMGDLNSLQNTKKMLQRLHGNLMFCLVNLGVWGALQSCNILLKGDDFERNELIGENGNCRDNSLCDRYLTQASTFFTSHCIKDGTEAGLSCVEVLKEPFFSKKLMRLIGILSSFRSRPNMKCIIFVNRIITARSLSYILRNLKFLSSWKCDYLVGVHSGLKSMSRKNTDVILQRFRSGEVNLLVATKVGEEGLDIQTCCLVIRFDLPETISSFIQSRGRARMPQSEYAFLVDRGNQSELNLIEHFNKGERKMNEEIASRKASTTFMDFDETIFKIDSTGATISSIGSVSLLHHYCSKLPHDEYFNPKAEFFYFDDSEGIVCHITLPANAAIHQVASTPQSSMEAAKKDACLKACRELYAVGALTNYLLPDEDNGNEESTQDLSDSDSCDEDDSRRELHEMLVPAALREPWMELDDPVFLHSYYIKFCPRPVDRLYKKFGLFVKASLPEEAAKMQLDLCLARGRSVNSELQPHGVTRFAKDEISLAMNFQQMFLKIILDRSKFIPEFVSLENNDFISSRSSTCYLLLPVIEYGNTIDVDWKLIRRCLSSPIFRNPRNAGNGKVLLLSNHLILANGPRITSDIVNSLVYVPCKDVFFFVSDVVLEKDGYSEYKDAKTHVEHYVDTPYALSYPHQPLLKVKQLFCLDNLLRKKGYSESREKEEHFVELPPEICQLKVIGFSKDIGSSLSLLPSIMHRLESLLVAIELKQRLSASFAEAADVTGHRVLEALTTGRCNERFSLERLEVLGDAFLKFAVGRHLFLMHDAIDEGQLTRKRSKLVKNSNLCRLAIANNLQVYIRDQSFEPNEFFALGRSCSTICNKQTEKNIHSPSRNSDTNVEVRCSKSHHWLHKKTIADVVEALVGVFIVEIGFKGAADFLNWIGIKVDFTASQIADICASSSIFRPIAAQMNVGALENLLGYQFVHKGLLAQAFVHPSYNNNFGGCYQRLEFLGDAVLDYLITSYLYSVYPELTPGQLTDLRSAYVNNIFFAAVAVDRSFHEFMKYDSSFLRESINKYVNFIRASSSSGGTIEAPKCPKPLGDLVESTIGAILLDVGFDLGRVWNIMLSFLNPVMNFSRLQLNPVRELKELCQSHKWELSFPYSKKDKTHFSVEAKVIGSVVTVTSCSVNINKKAAKRMAAQQTLAKLKAQGYKSKSKPLEEVLKMTCKKEAKLIGYDEMPTGVIASGLDNLTLMDDQPLASLHDPKIYPSNADSKRKVHYKQSLSPNQGLRWRPTKDAQKSRLKAASQTTGESRKSAKSLLHEICAANCWKPPEYECCNETGPSHLKEFTYKVVVEIEEGLDSILECYGDPSPKKKDAAEHAAQGALWYLNHLGY